MDDVALVRAQRGLLILDRAAGFDRPPARTLPVVGVPATKPDQRYRTDLRSCSCPDFQFRLGGRTPCKHMIAVRLWFAAWVAARLDQPDVATVWAAAVTALPRELTRGG